MTYENDAVIGSPIVPFVIDLNTTTDISEIENGELRIENVYDLQGRKILNSQFVNRRLNKGVYIVNGKKKVK